MSRSKWKGAFMHPSIFKSRKKKRLGNTIKIWSRSSVIPFFMIGKTAAIHNGKTFIRTPITREHVGLKFGELAFTRKHTRKEPTKKTKK